MRSLSRKKSRPFWTAVVGVTSMLALAPANAEQFPLWKIGMGVAGITLPDYRGFKESETYILLAPCFVYRGE